MKGLFSFLCLFGLFLFLLDGNVISKEVDAGNEAVPLQDNLGDHKYPVSTSVPRSQLYFDQGLILTYGFNHAEAAMSFRRGGASRMEPKSSTARRRSQANSDAGD